jgi:hypothetical protein
MSPVSPTTVQQTILAVKKTFFDWDLFTPVLEPIPEHKARPEARGATSLFDAKAKAQAMKIPKCHLDSKWLESFAHEIATTTPTVLAYLDAKAKAQAKGKATKIPKSHFDSKWLESLAREIESTTPKVLAYLDAKAKAQAKAKATNIPNYNLDSNWLEALARESETTTPKILAHLDAKAKAQAKAKAKATTNPFDNFWKFSCRFGETTPICKWKEPSKQQKEFINPKRFNTGIPTGTRNHLLVVDLDVKGDGVEEFKRQIQAQCKPNTLHVITPTGGENYYFHYAHPDPGTNQVIKSLLNKSTKFRGKGIDIRREGGYIVGRPSVRNGKAYEPTNLTKPIDIPASLVAWLLEGQATKTQKPKQSRSEVRQLSNNACKVSHNMENNACKELDNLQNLASNGYEYDLNYEQVWNMLEQLPDEYLTNYTTWFTVTSILKRHGKHVIWSEWSKKG